MPTITISEAVDAKLKTLVTEPFEQTRESIFEDLVDAEIERRGVTTARNGSHQAAGDSLRRLNPDSPGNLAWTRVRSATIDGREMTRPKWNYVMDNLHVLGKKQLGSFQALKDASQAHIMSGRHEDSGYKYLDEADLSIQGVDSNQAWTISLGLARELRVPIKLRVEWLDREGAAHPGQTAMLEWTPSA